MNYETRMTIRDHLLELRRRLIICVVALIITTAIGLVFADRILELLKAQAPASGYELIYTQVTEGFTTYVKIGLFAGAGLALPIFVFQLISFVAPGLTRRERKYLYAFMPAVFLLFLGGVLFCYFIILPFALRYLLGFTFVADPYIRVGDFITFVTTFLFFVGLAFETPIIILFLTKIGVVSRKRLASYRKYAFVLAFVVGAFITPTPDPINQSLVALPIYALFELGLLLARFV